MSGIIAVYALVVAVLLASNLKPPPQTYSVFQGCLHLACGLSVGLTGLAAGYAIGKVGDTVCYTMHQSLGEEDLASNRYADVLDTIGRAILHAAVAHLRRYGVDTHFR